MCGRGHSRAEQRQDPRRPDKRWKASASRPGRGDPDRWRCSRCAHRGIAGWLDNGRRGRHPLPAAEDREAVLTAAEEAARELQLPPSWLSEDVGLYAWTLPTGWQKRRVRIER